MFRELFCERPHSLPSDWAKNSLQSDRRIFYMGPWKVPALPLVGVYQVINFNSLGPLDWERNDYKGKLEMFSLQVPKFSQRCIFLLSKIISTLFHVSSRPTNISIQ